MDEAKYTNDMTTQSTQEQYIPRGEVTKPDGSGSSRSSSSWRLISVRDSNLGTVTDNTLA